ncbi:MAG: Ig-like domain-containing protein [Thermoanaerobaculales bacterium]|nr:Ig-like domain-containing protein [Thermoanaerobaculales bacterium]
MIGRPGTVAVWLGMVFLTTVPSGAQTLVAVDDSYGVPFADALVVEQPGVMSNDTYGGSPVSGATVTLIDPPLEGALECESDPVTYDLCPDGSFMYMPGSSLCWSESAYLAQLGALGGAGLIQEGFEDDAVWGVTRSPMTEPLVVSQGIRWESNHPDPPASNELTTGGGPARTGLWGLYDPEHGYATGTPAECDITNPPEHCLFKDGFTGTREAGGGLLVGAGGYLKGSAQPNLSMYLDGGPRIGLGRLTVGGHQFFGVIDTGGFSSFRIEESDGKVGQERYVFGDDFILATATSDTTPPQVTLVNSWYDTGDGELSEGEVTDTAIFQLLISFDEPVRDPIGSSDPHDVTNPTNYLLVNDGGNGFETASCAGGVAGNDVAVSVDWVTWEGSPVLTATLDVNGGVELPVASYRLLVCGTTSIHDWAGNTLDGDGNGVGGDDFVRNFTVYIPPNDPPTANPQSVTTPEDTAKAITLTGSDPNMDPLTFSIMTGPAHGGLSGTPPNVTYTPVPNYNGPDSFTFRVFDGTAYSAPATVSIDVLPVNDPPTADPQAVSTPQNTPVAITLTGSDVENDPLTFAIGTGPSHGLASGTPPDVTYTPAPGYVGPDSFTFTVFDGELYSGPATVSIMVTEVVLPVLTIEDASIIEGDAGTAMVAVTITLTPASASAVSVDWATGGGSATAGLDYTVAADTADFLAGATIATASVEVHGDLSDEPDETFDVTLSNPVGAVLGTPSTATVTIFDDDPMPDLAGTDLVVGEWVGDALVVISLSAASGYDVTVDYATLDGTATAPADYTAVAGSAFIAAGANSTTVAVPIVIDAVTEPDEVFTLELSNPTNAVLITTSVTVTIHDDPSLIFYDGFEAGNTTAWSGVVP